MRNPFEREVSVRTPIGGDTSIISCGGLSLSFAQQQYAVQAICMYAKLYDAAKEAVSFGGSLEQCSNALAKLEDVVREIGDE